MSRPDGRNSNRLLSRTHSTPAVGTAARDRSSERLGSAWHWSRPLVFAVCGMAAVACGCQQKIVDQPRADALEHSDFFENGAASRQPVPNTIARGEIIDNEEFVTGRHDGKLLQEFPVAVDAALLERGRARFTIFCTPCHDPTGHGRGMVVRRGFPQPPSYHIERLRDAPPGHFFDVMTHGFGRMPSYAGRVPPHDRWAITAYVKALQLSQHAPASELNDAERNQLTDGS